MAQGADGTQLRSLSRQWASDRSGRGSTPSQTRTGSREVGARYIKKTSYRISRFGPGSKRFSSFRKTTLLRWHRQGFKLSWKYQSRAASAKPKISAETVALIKEMARNNWLWEAERMRGELLKLGLHVCKRTIQKCMRLVRAAGPRGQKWSTFLHTHAEQIWACDVRRFGAYEILLARG
jgi:hypothetical protein